MYETVIGNHHSRSISDRTLRPIMSMQTILLIQTLQQVYTDHTGEQAELLAYWGRHIRARP